MKYWSPSFEHTTSRTPGYQRSHAPEIRFDLLLMGCFCLGEPAHRGGLSMYSSALVSLLIMYTIFMYNIRQWRKCRSSLPITVCYLLVWWDRVNQKLKGRRAAEIGYRCIRILLQWWECKRGGFTHQSEIFIMKLYALEEFYCII